jgi:hypothetical protein
MKYLAQVEALAVVSALSRLEFFIGVPGANRTEALGTNRVERPVRVSPVRESCARRFGHCCTSSIGRSEDILTGNTLPTMAPFAHVLSDRPLSAEEAFWLRWVGR